MTLSKILIKEDYKNKKVGCITKHYKIQDRTGSTDRVGAVHHRGILGIIIYLFL